MDDFRDRTEAASFAILGPIKNSKPVLTTTDLLQLGAVHLQAGYRRAGYNELLDRLSRTFVHTAMPPGGADDPFNFSETGTEIGPSNFKEGNS